MRAACRRIPTPSYLSRVEDAWAGSAPPREVTELAREETFAQKLEYERLGGQELLELAERRVRMEDLVSELRVMVEEARDGDDFDLDRALELCERMETCEEDDGR